MRVGLLHQEKHVEVGREIVKRMREIRKAQFELKKVKWEVVEGRVEMCVQKQFGKAGREVIEGFGVKADVDLEFFERGGEVVEILVEF